MTICFILYTAAVAPSWVDFNRRLTNPLSITTVGWCVAWTVVVMTTTLSWSINWAWYDRTAPEYFSLHKTKRRVFTARSELRKVLFLAVFGAVCDFFVCVWNISGTAERICAKFTGKTCLVPRSDEFEGQGQFRRPACGLCAEKHL